MVDTTGTLQSSLRELLPEYTVGVQYGFLPSDPDDPNPIPMYQVRAARRDPERNNELLVMVTSLSPELVECAAGSVASLVASSIAEAWDERNNTT